MIAPNTSLWVMNTIQLTLFCNRHLLNMLFDEQTGNHRRPVRADAFEELNHRCHRM